MWGAKVSCWSRMDWTRTSKEKGKRLQGQTCASIRKANKVLSELQLFLIQGRLRNELINNRNCITIKHVYLWFQLTICLSLAAESDWKVNNTDRLGSSCGQKSRYYNSASKFRCNNCNQRGHFTHACPQPKVSFRIIRFMLVLSTVACGIDFLTFCSE